MGTLNVTQLNTEKDRANYIHHLLNDIEALDVMIKKELIEDTPLRIGAEQEFCLVNNAFLPEGRSMELLEAINDNHFTTEIGNFNLDALLLGNNGFFKLHKQLDELLEKARHNVVKLIKY